MMRRSDHMRLAEIVKDAREEGQTRTVNASLDPEQIRREMNAAIRELLLAADDAGLTDSDPYKMIARQYAALMGHATQTLCMLLAETRDVSARAAAMRRSDREHVESMIDRGQRRTRSLVIVASAAVIAACSATDVAVRWFGPGPKIDLASPALIACEKSIREGDGGYRCTLDVRLLRAQPTRP